MPPPPVQKVFVDGKDVMPDVWEVLDKIRSFSGELSGWGTLVVGAWDSGALGERPERWCVWWVAGWGEGRAALGRLYLHLVATAHQTTTPFAFH